MSRKPPRYTTKQHVARLEQMFLRGDPCGHCPAAQGFDPDQTPIELWAFAPHPCDTCRRFVDIVGKFGCPCNILGVTEAIRRTTKAINAFRLKEANTKGR